MTTTLTPVWIAFACALSGCIAINDYPRFRVRSDGVDAGVRDAGRDSPAPECSAVDPCDPNPNPCVDVACVRGRCETTNNFDDCDDGEFCNGPDTCVGGICFHAGNPCGDSRCTPDGCGDCGRYQQPCCDDTGDEQCADGRECALAGVDLCGCIPTDCTDRTVCSSEGSCEECGTKGQPCCEDGCVPPWVCAESGTCN